MKSDLKQKSKATLSMNTIPWPQLPEWRVFYRNSLGKALQSQHDVLLQPIRNQALADIKDEPSKNAVKF